MWMLSTFTLRVYYIINNYNKYKWHILNNKVLHYNNIEGE